MSIHTVPSRDFTRGVARAKRLASDGPVLITDRGRPAYALLKIEDYYRLTGQPELTLLEFMDALPGTGGVEFEPQRADIDLKVPDLG